MDISYCIGLGTIKLYENCISAGKTKKMIQYKMVSIFKNLLLVLYMGIRIC